MLKGRLILRPRERRLALIASVLIGCWALVSWVAQPLWERNRDLHLHIESQTGKLQALSRLLAQAQTIERQYQGMAAYLQTTDTEEARGTFLNELEALSRSASLQVNLKPRPVKREGHISRFEVELDVEGSQDRLLGFLDALFGMPRLMTIERLRLASIPMKENWLRANLVIQRLVLQQ